MHLTKLYEETSLTNTKATSKHGVLGLLRALQPQLHPKLPIRINAVAPSWTNTPIVPRAVVAAVGESNIQSPDVVARSVALLMADKTRHGELVYSAVGEFVEMENGETGFHALTKQMMERAKRDEKKELLAAEKRVDEVIEGMAEKNQGV